ncbi:MAG: ATP-binding protein [Polyangia bacterium]
MLKQVRFRSWRSFRDATLYLDPLTVLIGANASGKSNAVDGLELLARTAQGMWVDTAIAGDEQIAGLRGGLEWAALRGRSGFMLEVELGEAGQTLVYKLQVKTRASRSDALSVTESLSQKVATGKQKWFRGSGNLRSITALYGFAGGFFDEKYLKGAQEEQLSEDVRPVQKTLSRIFVLSPDPQRMRGYARLSEELDRHGGNVAGVIASLPDERRREVEAALSGYLKRLPEHGVAAVRTECYGLTKSDAMLICTEQWGTAKAPIEIDARCMSDGTLRFLAMATALLTRPAGSLLVLEDIDIGIHPSRAGLLLELLRTEGARRGVDVLVTTHDEAFLDALPPELWPFVQVAYRDAKSGESRLIPLDEIEGYAKLVAAGPLGRATARGLIERLLQASPPPSPEPPSAE